MTGVFVLPSLAAAQDPPAEPAETHAPPADTHAPPASTHAPPADTHATPGDTHAPTHAQIGDDEHGTPTPSDDGALSAADEAEGDEIAATHDQAKYAAYIRKMVAMLREKIIPKLEEGMIAKHEKKMTRLTYGLLGTAACGLLLLFMPLFLAKKYPGKMGILVKSSAVAALSAVVVLSLFAGVVLLIKTVQGEFAKQTNPTVMIVEATLDTLDDEAEDLVDMGPGIIQPTLDHMRDSDEVLPVVLFENVKRLVKDADPFISAAMVLKRGMFLLEYLPMVTTGIAILLFIVGAVPIMKELIALPGRAASGGDTGPIISQAFKYVGLEFIAALGMIAGVIAITLASAESLALAIRPTVHDLLSYFFENVTYATQPKEISSGLLYSSLILVTLSLIVSLLLLIVSGVLYLGKIHKIFQARVHQGVPLKSHGKFWLWGTLALVFAQIFPFAFSLASEPLIDKIRHAATAKEDDHNWTLLLLSGPLIMVVGFLFVFWAMRGFKGLAYILKYKPLPAPPVATPAPAAA